MIDIRHNPGRVKVTFTKEQLAAFEALAKHRQYSKDGVASQRITPHATDLDIHIQGIVGESALAHVLGLTVDTSTAPGGDNGFDFELYGVTIDVKLQQGFLLFNSMDKFRSDIAVLTQSNRRKWDTVFVEGWVTREEFAARCFKSDFGYGERLCYRPIDMHPISTLRTYCLLRAQTLSTMRPPMRPYSPQTAQEPTATFECEGFMDRWG